MPSPPGTPRRPMGHRDKARIFGEHSKTAAQFMQPSTPPHHAVDSRRSAAMAQAKAAGGVKTPYGKGYAKNSARGPLIPMTPAEKGSHPIPAHPSHPRVKRPHNPAKG